MSALGSTLVWACLLALLAVIAYSRPLLTGLFKHDQKIGDMFLFADNVNVKDNAALRTWRGVVPIWREPLTMPQFSPVGYTSLLLDYNLWGRLATRFHLDYRTFLQRLTFAYHFTNVLIHIGNALLVWAIARQLGLRGPWAAGAIFALHPLAVQSVTWISQRPVLLGMFFMLAALLAYLRFANPISIGETVAPAASTRRNKSVAYALSIALFICAILSEPATAVFPLLVLVILWWKRPGLHARDLLPLTPHLTIALITLIGAFAVSTRQGSSSVGSVLDASPALPIMQRVPVIARAIWVSAESSVFPIGLAFAYPRWDATPAWQWIFPAGLVLALLIGWAYRASPRGRGFTAAALLFVLAVLPGTMFAKPLALRGGFIADSLVYMALPAIVVPIVAVIAGWLTSADDRLRPIAYLVGTLGVVAGVVFTFSNDRSYINNHVLWAKTVERYPRSTYALNRLGELEMARKQFSEAELRERNIIRLDPDAAFAPVKRSYTEAESRFREALEINSSDWAAMINLGQVYLMRGEWDRAASQFLAAERAGAPRAISRRSLADALQAGGDSSAAIGELQSVLASDPNNVYARNSLGMIRYQRGEYPEAIAEYKRALEINPRLTAARMNLAGAYGAQGRHVDALNELTRAWEFEPDNAQTLMNLAAVLGTLSDTRPPDERIRLLGEAEKRFRMAIALDSDFAQAWDNYGIVLARLARSDPNQRSKMKDAVYAFNRAASLEPENAKFAQHLESAKLEAGEQPNLNRR